MSKTSEKDEEESSEVREGGLEVEIWRGVDNGQDDGNCVEEEGHTGGV